MSIIKKVNSIQDSNFHINFYIWKINITNLIHISHFNLEKNNNEFTSSQPFFIWIIENIKFDASQPRINQIHLCHFHIWKNENNQILLNQPFSYLIQMRIINVIQVSKTCFLTLLSPLLPAANVWSPPPAWPHTPEWAQE